GDGHVWWNGPQKLLPWGNLPTRLWFKLRERAEAALPGPVYIALGPDNQHYVRYADGTVDHYSFHGELMRELHERGRGGYVQSLAFAPGGGYFVLYSDGTYAAQGLPPGLQAELWSQSAARVEHINIGAHGEWFVRYADGRWRCGDHTGCQSLAHTIGHLQDRLYGIRRVTFGADCSWVVEF
ncbi:hypothetical protein JKP88DRAFT_136066, partial [Tribonema minus]